MQPARRCHACGATEVDGLQTLKRCPICVERKLPSTYFCNEACQAAVWKQHARWHKQQKKEDEMRRQALPHLVDADFDTAQAVASMAENSESEYDTLLATGTKHVAAGNLRHATKAFSKAVALAPMDARAYLGLGQACARSYDFKGAAQAWSKAAEVVPGFPDYNAEGWSMYVPRAFMMHSKTECEDVPKPAWWNDVALLELSAKVASLPTDRKADESPLEGRYFMRAMVLSAGTVKVTWQARPRTAAELKEAAKYWQLVAKVTCESADDKRRYIGYGVQLNMAAMRIDELHMASVN